LPDQQCHKHEEQAGANHAHSFLWKKAESLSSHRRICPERRPSWLPNLDRGGIVHQGSLECDFTARVTIFPLILFVAIALDQNVTCGCGAPQIFTDSVPE
jgi:hypothetical protein